MKPEEFIHSLQETNESDTEKPRLITVLEHMNSRQLDQIKIMETDANPKEVYLFDALLDPAEGKITGNILAFTDGKVETVSEMESKTGGAVVKKTHIHDFNIIMLRSWEGYNKTSLEDVTYELYVVPEAGQAVTDLVEKYKQKTNSPAPKPE